VEYELGKGRSELTIDAEGWIARRGGLDLEGRSLDDVPIARVAGDVANDLQGAELARIDATGPPTCSRPSRSASTTVSS
jgi:hypothetical protein